MKPPRVSETWLYRYRFIFGYLLLFGVGILSLFYRLGSLVSGINDYEAQSASISLNIGSLINRPIDFIYHILQFISVQILGPSPLAIRLPSVLLTLLALGLFFYVLEHRFSKRAAITTTLLFVVTSWLLNTVRLGGPMALTILLLLALLFFATKLNNKYHLGWLIGLVIVAAISLYSPYFIYLLSVGILLSVPEIKSKAKEVNNRDLYIALGLFALLIVPLVYAVIRDFDVAKSLLAIPDNLPTLKQYFTNLNDVIGHVIWRSKEVPILHLGTLPMLEIFSVSMVALGLYHYDHELTKNLSRLLLGGLLISVLLLAIGANQFDYALMLPFVYFVLTGGLVILFSQWNEIFPRNPVARVIAIIPIGLLLLIVGYYHAERYFLAWPNNPEVVREHSEAYNELSVLLEENSAYTTILNSEKETAVMEPLDEYYGDVVFTDSLDDIANSSSERRLIITDKAYQDLSEASKKMLGSPTRTIASRYRSNPTVLWIYSVSL